MNDSNSAKATFSDFEEWYEATFSARAKLLADNTKKPPHGQQFFRSDLKEAFQAGARWARQRTIGYD